MNELVPRDRSTLLEPAPLYRGEVLPVSIPEQTEYDLADLVRATFENKLLILGLAVLGGAAGLGIAFLQQPVYRATAMLEIRQPNEDFLNLKTVQASKAQGPLADDSYLPTQVEIILDDTLLERAVERLKLDQHAEFAPPSGWRASLIRRSRWWPESDLQAKPYATKRVRQHIVVRAARPGSIIRLSYEAQDPHLAAEVVNTVAAEYLMQDSETRRLSIRRTEESLLDQIADLKERLAASETALQEYARKSDLFFVADGRSTAEERLRQFDAELVKAQVERIASQSERDSAGTSVESVQTVAANPTLIELRSKVNELRRQYAELISIYQPDFHKVVVVRSQLDEAERALQEHLRDAREQIEKRYKAAQAREGMLLQAYQQQTSKVSGQAFQAITYTMLKNEVETNRKIYEEMLQRVKEAGIASAIQTSAARIVSPAVAPISPDRPNTPLNVTFGLLVGLIGAISLVVMKEAVQGPVRKPGDVARYLGVRELGAVPQAVRPRRTKIVRGQLESLVDDLGTGPLGLREQNVLNGASSRSASAGEEPLELTVWADRGSEFAESVRGALNSVLTAERDKGARVFVMGSPSISDGKTMLATNLGIAMAEIGRRVVLVDGDLRQPRLHEILKCANSWGLSTLLRETTPLENAPLQALAKPTEIPGLYLLPSGPGVENIPVLLHSSRLHELMAELRRHFDMVLVDSPAALSFNDFRVLARAADGAVLILSTSRTTHEAASELVQRLNWDGVPILGVLLNRWNPRQKNRAYGYGYHVRDADT